MRASAINAKEDVLKADELIQAGTPFICFDLETTGTSTISDRAISVSAIKVMVTDGLPEVVGRFNTLVNPGFHIPKEASDVNHIYDENVKGAPDEDKVYDGLRRFLGPKPFLCGYNSKSFDIGFINAMYGRRGEVLEPLMHVDVYEMAKETLDLKNYKLENVAHELGADTGLEFHNSLDDCIATFRCFMMLMKEYTVPDVPVHELKRAAIKGMQYWHGPSHTLERIYIKTDPYTKTYYDIYKKEWRSDGEIDLTALKEDAFSMCHVSGESDFVRVVKAGAAS